MLSNTSATPISINSTDDTPATSTQPTLDTEINDTSSNWKAQLISLGRYISSAGTATFGIKTVTTFFSNYGNNAIPFKELPTLNETNPELDYAIIALVVLANLTVNKLRFQFLFDKKHEANNKSILKEPVVAAVNFNNHISASGAALGGLNGGIAFLKLFSIVKANQGSIISSFSDITFGKTILLSFAGFCAYAGYKGFMKYQYPIGNDGAIAFTRHYTGKLHDPRDPEKQRGEDWSLWAGIKAFGITAPFLLASPVLNYFTASRVVQYLPFHENIPKPAITAICYASFLSGAGSTISINGVKNYDAAKKKHTPHPPETSWEHFVHKGGYILGSIDATATALGFYAALQIVAHENLEFPLYNTNQAILFITVLAAVCACLSSITLNLNHSLDKFLKNSHEKRGAGPAPIPPTRSETALQNYTLFNQAVRNFATEQGQRETDGLIRRMA
jgi:hypothetical protein